MIRLALAVCLLSFCAACAIIPEQVEVNYTSDPTVVKTPVAGAPIVGLQVIDSRHVESAVWIADKKNGYGMRMASINAQKPVADLVREALVAELQARAIRVGDGRMSVAVEITHLETEYRLRFLTVGAVGTMNLSVLVKRVDGSIAYARTFATTNDADGLMGVPAMARQGIEAVLSKIIGQIMADPAFLGALSVRAAVS